MNTSAFYLMIFLEPTWQSWAYQQKLIMALVGITVTALFVLLAPRKTHRADSPNIWAIGIVVALFCVGMTYPIVNIMPRRIAHHNETNAIAVLENLYLAESKFREKTKRFGTLAELANEGLVGKPLANGQIIRGYKFTNTDVTATTFCLHADRAEHTSGFRDFHVTEQEEYRSIESQIKGTVPRGQGQDLFSDYK